VECTEKTRARDFGFSALGDSTALLGRKRLPKEILQLADQRIAVGLILNEIWKFKVEIPSKWMTCIP
jgi:hypothetical protein